MSKSFTELIPSFPNNQTILEAVSKTLDHMETHNKIMVSISGGSDSDILIDLFERIGYEPGKVIYVWFDTGFEYDATKRHLIYLEEKYGVTIQRHKAKKPIPLSIKEYGGPFLSKLDSMYISRLQKHGFQWEDGTYEELYLKYPHCKAALKWWCDAWGKPHSPFSVARLSGMKEFIQKNPPPSISDRCCDFAKKNVAYEIESFYDCDLSVVGVRRAEGGRRATAYKSCYTPSGNHIAQFRPIYYFSDKDKTEYEEFCNIVHSDCYTVYGLKRTGCACCPFGSGFEKELEVAKKFEPKLYTAACNIFGESYQYTREYRKFKKNIKKGSESGAE